MVRSATLDDLPDIAAALKSHDLTDQIREGPAFVGPGLEDVIVGSLVQAPPVYDPGGKVCLIRNFVFSEPTFGKELIEAVDRWTYEHRGVLTCVECRSDEIGKRDLLQSLGFTVASDWYERDGNLPILDTDGIRPAEIEDLPLIVELCEQSRMGYQTYQPVFWRKAADSFDRHLAHLENVLNSRSQVVLTHELGGVVTVDPRQGSCFTDDFEVADRSAWPTVGASLLCAGVKAAAAHQTQVVCANGDGSKKQMLESLGYRLTHQWFVRPLPSLAG